MEQIIDHQRLISLFFSELPDDAAAHIAEFLYELAACLEESYLAQIRRHHFESRPRDDYNPDQLDLFSFVSSHGARAYEGQPLWQPTPEIVTHIMVSDLDPKPYIVRASLC